MAKQDAAGRSPNLFEDPAIAQSAKDDPFAKFLSENWRQVAGTVLVAVLVVWGYNTFRATNEAKRAAASDLFADVRTNYSLYINQSNSLSQSKVELATATDDKKKGELTTRITKLESDTKDQKAKLERMIQALEDNLVEPFPRLAHLYRALLLVREGDIARVRSVLGVESWESVGSPGSPDRFVSELSALTLGKALVDRDDSIGEGIKVLAGLAERGTTAQIPAVLSLSAVVTTPEDKQMVERFIADIETKNPAQIKFLAQAKERLGN